MWKSGDDHVLKLEKEKDNEGIVNEVRANEALLNSLATSSSSTVLSMCAATLRKKAFDKMAVSEGSCESGGNGDDCAYECFSRGLSKDPWRPIRTAE